MRDSVTAKKKSLDEINKKLRVAEEGNLREVVGTQSKLASERTVRESIEAIVAEYSNGWSLSSIQRSFDQILATAGACTEDAASKMTIQAMKAALVTNNAAVKTKELELNALLKSCAAQLTTLAGQLKVSHQRMSGDVATKLAELKARGGFPFHGCHFMANDSRKRNGGVSSRRCSRGEFDDRLLAHYAIIATL